MIELVLTENVNEKYPNWNHPILFVISIVKDNRPIGQLVFYSSFNSLNRTILDIFIEKTYRSRWLYKHLAKQLDNLVIDTCQQMGLDFIITRLNNPKSLRLLEFFGFTKYNNSKYYRRI